VNREQFLAGMKVAAVVAAGLFLFVAFFRVGYDSGKLDCPRPGQNPPLADSGAPCGDPGSGKNCVYDAVAERLRVEKQYVDDQISLHKEYLGLQDKLVELMAACANLPHDEWEAKHCTQSREKLRKEYQAIKAKSDAIEAAHNKFKEAAR
jgi:hypothetical protein